jgi:uncharacterized protein
LRNSTTFAPVRERTPSRRAPRTAWLATFAALCAWLGTFFAPGALAQQLAPIPPVARVTDQTGTLRPEQVAALEQKLAALESRKGSQLAVLLVPTTQPEDIAQYGIRVADAWKLGRKGVDDGAILIVALDDRRMRIEVGYGLEGVITDLSANRILDEFLRPSFRAGDFYGGIDAAVDRMIGLVDGEPLPEPVRQSRGDAQGGGFGAILPVLLIMGLIAGPILRRIFGRPLGSLATGGLAGFLAWTLVGLLGVAVFAAIATFFFTLVGGLGGNRWASGRRGGGPWGGGFGGGGFGGGGFGGGGGWSGGGGGFGGGGASGSW